MDDSIRILNKARKYIPGGFSTDIKRVGALFASDFGPAYFTKAAGVELTEYTIFMIASFLAATGATLAGFGSSALLIPVAISFFDLKTAIFLVACFHLFNNLFKIRLFWDKIDFKTFLYFGIPSICFSFVGAILITILPLGVITRILAVFLISYAVYSLFKPKLALRKSWKVAVLGGSLSGFFAGLIGLGGALRSSFLVAFDFPKEVYVATSAMIAVVIDFTRIPTYIFSGSVQTSPELFLIPFLIASAYFGVRFGKNLLKRIDQQTFRQIVSIALLLVGIKLLI
jgi:uncharacterized membrane protein YfcA